MQTSQLDYRVPSLQQCLEGFVDSFRYSVVISSSVWTKPVSGIQYQYFRLHSFRDIFLPF